MNGRINRLKCHLANILEHKVGIYEKSTLEIVHIANQSLNDMGRKREEREALRLELATNGVVRTSATTNLSGMSGSESPSPTSPSTMPSASSLFFVVRTTIGAQPSIR